MMQWLICWTMAKSKQKNFIYPKKKLVVYKTRTSKKDVRVLYNGVICLKISGKNQQKETPGTVEIKQGEKHEKNGIFFVVFY